MKKLLAAILTLALLTSLALCAASAEEELTVQDTTLAFMTPSVFAEYFNGMMNALADEYADNLGEEGVEIYTPAADAVKIWNALMEAGDGELIPCGLGARDTLRLEAGMPLYGHEMDDWQKSRHR